MNLVGVVLVVAGVLLVWCGGFALGRLYRRPLKLLLDAACGSEVRLRNGHPVGGDEPLVCDNTICRVLLEGPTINRLYAGVEFHDGETCPAVEYRLCDACMAAVKQSIEEKIRRQGYGR